MANRREWEQYSSSNPFRCRRTYAPFRARNMSKKNSIDGGCLCGACRYRSVGEPINVRACHCHRCQKATGSSFYARVMVPLDSLVRSGPVRFFDAGTGVRRGFCSECGTTLFSERRSANAIGLTRWLASIFRGSASVSCVLPPALARGLTSPRTSPHAASRCQSRSRRISGGLCSSERPA
jgi:hypothetical protein